MEEVNLTEVGRKKIFENLEKTKRGIPLSKKIKDWWIKGFQLNRCYVPHWDEIKDIFLDYEVDLNRQGPIITLQSLKQVRCAKKLTEMLKKDPEVREMATAAFSPLRSQYDSPEDLDYEKAIEGTIFIMLLRLIPEFCLKSGMEQLEGYIQDNGSKNHLNQIFSVHGTILDTEKDIDKIICNMVKEARKNDKKG